MSFKYDESELSNEVLNCIEKNDIGLLNNVIHESTLISRKFAKKVITTISNTLFNVLDAGNVCESVDSFKDITLEDLRKRIVGMSSCPGNLDSASFDELIAYVNDRVYTSRSIKVMKCAIHLMDELRPYTDDYVDTLNMVSKCKNSEIRAYCCGLFEDYSQYRDDLDERVNKVFKFREDFSNRWETEYSDEQKVFINNMAKLFADNYIIGDIYPIDINSGEYLVSFKGYIFENEETNRLFIDRDMFNTVKAIVLCDYIVGLAKKGEIIFNEDYQAKFESLFKPGKVLVNSDN